MPQQLRILLLLCLPLLSCLAAAAQTQPAENAALHYRRVGFVFPASRDAVSYTVEISTETCNTEDSFKNRIILRAVSKGNRVLGEVPYFGKQYTWRVTTTTKKGAKVKGPFQHFSTLEIPEVDTCLLRFRIMKQATKYKDAYIFIDGHRTLYDMKGNPVWFLPMKAEVGIGKGEVRDLKATPQGTITFLQHDKAYEMNYNGDTLWKAPSKGVVSGDTVEHYHHEFTRLNNGHYMVLGVESMFWDHMYGPKGDNEASDEPGQQRGVNKKNALNTKIDFGTLLEYDENGKLVWSWKSSNYFMASDLVNYNPEHRTKVIDVHENAFFFDEENQFVYLSFKNISRILKIKYPEGTVVNAYGETYKAGVPPSGNGLFCDQHACKYSKKGYLYLYNNNACNDSTELPTVLLMKESAEGNELKKVWEFKCTSEGVVLQPNIRDMKARQKLLEQNNMKPKLGRGTLLRSTSGGNVLELPDHSIFVCMNTQYGKIFIVTPDKKVIWSGIPERYIGNRDEWYITPQQYRASIVTSSELDRIIWNSAK